MRNPVDAASGGRNRASDERPSGLAKDTAPTEPSLTRASSARDRVTPPATETTAARSEFASRDVRAKVMERVRNRSRRSDDAESAPEPRKAPEAPRTEAREPRTTRTETPAPRAGSLPRTNFSAPEKESAPAAARSSGFRSRFSRPPVAYDLDEVGDQQLSFDESDGQDRGTPERDARDGQTAATPELPERDDDYLSGDRSGQADVASPSFGDVEPDSGARRDDWSSDDSDLAAAEYGDTQTYEVSDYPTVDGYEREFSQYGDPDGYSSDDESYAPEPGYVEPELGSTDDGYGYQDDDDGVTTRSADDYIVEDYDDGAASQDDTYVVGDDDAAALDRERELSLAPEPYIDDTGTDTRDDLRADSSMDLRADARDAGQTVDPQYSGEFDDFEKPKSRKPLLLIASLGGIAVVAGGLVFAYQYFSDGGNGQVPIVRVDGGTTKVAPDDPGGVEIPHQNKLIYDRIVGQSSTVDEQVVKREENVIALNNPENTGDSASQDDASAGDDSGIPIPPAPISPDATDAGGDDAGINEAIGILQGQQTDQSEQGGQNDTNSQVGIPIVPLPSTNSETESSSASSQQDDDASSSESSGTTPEAPELRTETVTPPEPQTVSTPTRTAPPVPREKPDAPVRPTRVVSVDDSTRNDTGASGSGPIQLTPVPRPPSNASNPAPSPTTPVQSIEVTNVESTTPAPPTPAPVTGSGNYLIQIAAFRSEAEAVAEYERLSNRHASLLRGYGPIIQRADLGSRGIYYRLRVGPIDGKQRASGLCDSLLAAGETDCLVRRR